MGIVYAVCAWGLSGDVFGPQKGKIMTEPTEEQWFIMELMAELGMKEGGLGIYNNSDYGVIVCVQPGGDVWIIRRRINAENGALGLIDIKVRKR
jgi:hypothetical protein